MRTEASGKNARTSEAPGDMWQAVDPHLWQGRVDLDDGETARRWHQCITRLADPLSGQAPGIRGSALLGFACDAGVARNHGRCGAAGGPAALRAALANAAWHQQAPAYDAGDVVCHGDALEAAQTAFGQRVAALLAAGHRPLLIGGGHEMAWGSWQGTALYGATRAAPEIGIINFDAHFDLRAGAQGSSGTPFRQIAEDCAARGWPFHYLCLGIARPANTAALFERASALGADWLEDTQLAPWHLEAARRHLAGFIARVDALHLSIDLDVLPAASAPGVSAPAARGIELAVLETLLDDVLASGKLWLAEVAELNPQFDPDRRTTRLAARLISRLAV